MVGEELPYFLDYFEEVARREGFWREDLVQKILDNHGSPRGLKDVPEKWQRVFATAHDVSPEWHGRGAAGGPGPPPPPPPKKQTPPPAGPPRGGKEEPAPPLR